MQNKNPPGRPPKGNVTQSVRIIFRAEPAEKKSFERAAEKECLSLTEWIKHQLNRAVAQELEE